MGVDKYFNETPSSPLGTRHTRDQLVASAVLFLKLTTNDVRELRNQELNNKKLVHMTYIFISS